MKSTLKEIYTYKKFLLFFLSSLVGVSVDLIVFYALSQITSNIFLVNIISSSFAIATTYYVSTSILFTERKKNKKDFLSIFLWYIISINFFSFFIMFLHTQTMFELMICKVISLPLSFVLNFTFNSLYFKRRT